MASFVMRALSVLIVAVIASGQQPAKPGYVGSTVCRACHPDVWSKFYKNPHFKSIASGKEDPANTGCEGCHGPAEGHLKAHGGKASIISFPALSPKQVGAACLR